MSALCVTGSPVTLMQPDCGVWGGESTLAGRAIARLSVMQVFKNVLLYLGVSKGGQTLGLHAILGAVDTKQVWT